MKTTTTPQIAYDDVGDAQRDGGPALLCLPGWCAPRDAFRPLYPHVERRTLALDWRGHGGSAPAVDDFGAAQLVDDALAVIDHAGVDRVVPVATAHAGFVAIELRRRLGARRVPGVVLVDWMVLGAPPPFFDALQALARPESWAAVRDQLFAMWTTAVDDPGVHAYVRKMAGSGGEMWMRAAREIRAAFAATPVPLDALAGVPTLHVYAQPRDDAFLAAQQERAARTPSFHVHRVDAASHFPTVEAPAQVAAAIAAFLRASP